MRSWIGNIDSPTSCLVRKFGDFHLRETINSHIRRLESQDFVCRHLCETPAQFKLRMKKIEDFMNSPAFNAEGGKGLLGLAKELRREILEVVRWFKNRTGLSRIIFQGHGTGIMKLLQRVKIPQEAELQNDVHDK